MDVYKPDDKRGRARERVEARKRRREPMARPLDANAPLRSADHSAPTQPMSAVSNEANVSGDTHRNPRVSIPRMPNMPIPSEGAQRVARTAARSAARRAVSAARTVERVDLRQVRRAGGSAKRAGSQVAWWVRDAIWYTRHNPPVLFGIIGSIAAVFVLYILFHLFTGRIFPNVYTAGINLGGLTADEAVAALQAYWDNDLRIDLVDGERVWSVSTSELGLRLDARETVEKMRAVGLSGIPFGYEVIPSMEMDLLVSQNRLLDISEEAQIQPYNAGYRWEGDLLVGVEGTDGRFLDVSGTLDQLYENLADVIVERRMDMVMTSVAPEVRDPDPYMDQVRALVAQPFIVNGYDPFTNENYTWSTDRTTFISWLEAGQESLTLRESAFVPFIDAQSSGLRASNPLRYLEPTETISAVRNAIREGRSSVNLRVRYQGTTYEVQSGDTGYFIARKTGLPFYLIQDANPGRDWEAMLSPGEIINLPSRDATIPNEVIPNKRIVVNIDTQYLVAYENGQVVFDWPISTGMDYAPTYPGVYQILSHVDLATGSSFELCTADTCGTWDMYWFMGIYEVVPGLVNGFHGAVVLPNGTYLGGGNVGRPFTYGCVMSRNEDAERLYRWADEGTIVEIVSWAYEPQSDLARAVVDGTWRDLPRAIPSNETAAGT